MAWLIALLFGCRHLKTSFPVTMKRGKRCQTPAASVTGTYTVCLQCGKEFAYDWQEMKVVPIPPVPKLVKQRKRAEVLEIDRNQHKVVRFR